MSTLRAVQLSYSTCSLVECSHAENETVSLRWQKEYQNCQNFRITRNKDKQVIYRHVSAVE